MFTAAKQKFLFLPSVGVGTQGEAYAETLESRSVELGMSDNPEDQRLASALRSHVARSQHHMRNVPGAGVRRAVLVWLTGREILTSHMVNADRFVYSPYEAMLAEAKNLEQRAQLRREMLEITLLHQLTLARQYRATLFWPSLRAPFRRPDLLDRYRIRGGQLRATDEVHIATLRARIPPIGQIMRMGPDGVMLRSLGENYFDDLRMIADGIPVPLDQIQQDLRDYARRIRRECRTNLAENLSIGSDVLGSIGIPGAPLVVGLFSAISAFLPGATHRATVRIARIREPRDTPKPTSA